MSVYFIQDEHGRMKIGQSSDPEGRRNTLQTSHADRLEIVRVVEDAGLPTEKWLHRKFATRRLQGEWFTFHPDMLTVVTPDELPQRRVERINRATGQPIPSHGRHTVGEVYLALKELDAIRNKLNNC